MNLMQAGDHLDHYRIEDLVACTTTAITFRGTDLRSGLAVAIKVLREEAASDPSIRNRFQRERKIGRRLDHPGVIKFVADEPRGQQYVVTEWSDGRSLRSILQECGSLSVERAVRLSLGICDALYYIHSRGIVHRDLKPENVIVRSDDQIRLIDFGIAVAGGAQRLVLGNSLDGLGTPDYISPEEVRGIRGDARSDLYALGIMLHEMLTGTVPFDGCNPLVVMNQRLISDPVPLRSIATDVSPHLEAIVRRALERDARRRYSSAFEFASDLENYGRPVPATDAKPRNWKKRWTLGRRVRRSTRIEGTGMDTRYPQAG
jgi:serine/threonine protein kinase